MIIGHHKQKDILDRFLKEKNIPHALLFCGPSKVGKRSLATEFLMRINCDTETACGNCESCLQVIKGAHPDILHVFPEEGEIRTGQIDEIIEKVSLKGYMARFKGIVIDDIHLANIEAQNKLLKTLEEPPGDTVMILVTEYPLALLSTVLSRSFRMSFSFVSSEEITSFLKNEEISALSFGRPGVAVEYLNDPQKKKDKESIQKEFYKIKEGNLAFRFRKVKDVAKREDRENILKCWLECVYEDFLGKIKKKENVKKVGDVLEELENAILLNRRTNANIQLALEKIMIKL